MQYIHVDFFNARAGMWYLYIKNYNKQNFLEKNLKIEVINQIHSPLKHVTNEQAACDKMAAGDLYYRYLWV